MILRGAWLAAILLAGYSASADDAAQVRFAAIDVLLESTEPVAAWQFELRETDGRMVVVGVENGASAVFDRAPYFDREAVRLGTADRIIVADYSLAPSHMLPIGKTRIATIHVRLSGNRPASFDLRLITAANADGINVDAAISIDESTGS